MARPTEDELIARYFAPLAKDLGALKLKDDAAFIPPRPGFDLVITADQIAAETDFFPHDPPRFLARVPHGYHDAECIRADLNAAGFVDVLVDARNDRSKAGSPLEPAIAYCQGTPLRTEIEGRDASRLQDATRRAADALTHRFGSGAIEGRIRAFVVTAVS